MESSSGESSDHSSRGWKEQSWRWWDSTGVQRVAMSLGQNEAMANGSQTSWFWCLLWEPVPGTREQAHLPARNGGDQLRVDLTLSPSRWAGWSYGTGGLVLFSIPPIMTI